MRSRRMRKRRRRRSRRWRKRRRSRRWRKRKRSKRKPVLAGLVTRPPAAPAPGRQNVPRGR